MNRSSVAIGLVLIGAAAAPAIYRYVTQPDDPNAQGNATGHSGGGYHGGSWFHGGGSSSSSGRSGVGSPTGGFGSTGHAASSGS